MLPHKRFWSFRHNTFGIFRRPSYDFVSFQYLSLLLEYQDMTNIYLQKLTEDTNFLNHSVPIFKILLTSLCLSITNPFFTFDYLHVTNCCLYKKRKFKPILIDGVAMLMKHPPCGNFTPGKINLFEKSHFTLPLLLNNLGYFETNLDLGCPTKG